MEYEEDRKGWTGSAVPYRKADVEGKAGLAVKGWQGFAWTVVTVLVFAWILTSVLDVFV